MILLLKYSFAEKGDTEMLKKLWLSSFDDKEEAVDLFLGEYFDENKTAVCKDEDEIVSMLFLIDAKMSINGQAREIYYIYAAATSKDYRNRGIMGRLLAFSENEAKKQGKAALVLLPQTNKLVSFYEKYGYRAFFKSRTFSLTNITKGDCKEAFAGENEIREKYLPDNSVLWSGEHFEFLEKFYALYGGKVVKTNNSYAIVSSFDEKICEISEFFAPKADFNSLFSIICGKFPSEEYVFTTSENCFESFGKVNCKGMIKLLFGSLSELKPGYLGAALE